MQFKNKLYEGYKTSKLFIITTNNFFLTEKELKNSFFIGVDKGCEYLIDHQNIGKNLLAIGDFDSISQSYQKKLSSCFQKVLKKPKEKSKTDLHLALDYYFKYLKFQEINIFAKGKRNDHLIFDLFLIVKKFFHKPLLKVTYFDNHNIFYFLQKGSYTIEKVYDYFSFFTFSSAIVSLNSAKWNLTNKKINKNNLSTISNEFIDAKLVIEVKKGYVFLVQSKD